MKVASSWERPVPTLSFRETKRGSQQVLLKDLILALLMGFVVVLTDPVNETDIIQY